MSKVYFGEWAGTNWHGHQGREAVADDFEVKLADDMKILFASYTDENYSGSATVIFEQGGKLYIVNGGHCSCYGLEGQWMPEETSMEALRKFDWTGHLYDLGSDGKKALERLLHEDPAA